MTCGKFKVLAYNMVIIMFPVMSVQCDFQMHLTGLQLFQGRQYSNVYEGVKLATYNYMD